MANQPLTVAESHEWDSAADWCAARNLAGNTGDALPTMLSTRVFEEIAQHTEAFQRDIRAAAYARVVTS